MIGVFAMNISPLRDARLYDEAVQRVGEERIKKINKCKNEADKIRSLGAGVLFAYALTNRGLMRQECKLIQCQIEDILLFPSLKGDIEVHYGLQGKPYLPKEDGLFFNLSHSGEYVLCVIADQEVGADIQQIKEQRLDKVEQIAKKIMADTEYAAWCGLEEKEKVNAFYRCWSCKECFVKWTGEGLSRPLNSIIVDKEQYVVFDEIEGYIVAITTKG